MGTIGTAPYPVQTAYGIQLRDMEVKIDEETLGDLNPLSKIEVNFNGAGITQIEEKAYEEIITK